MDDDLTGDIDRLLAMLRDGRAEQVVVEARRGLAATPYHEDYRAVLIAALLDVGEVDDALEQAQFGVAELPTSLPLRGLLVRSLLAGHRWSEAVDAADELVRIDHGDAGAQYLSAQANASLAGSLADRSREQRVALDAAAAAAQQAIAAAPDSAEPHFLAGRIALMSRDWAAARAAANQGLTIDPDSADGHAILSEALRGDGDLAGARDHARRAVRSDPSRRDLSVVLERSGPSLWQWSVAGMLLFIPVASALDGSFEAWMFMSGALGAGGLAWLRSRSR